MSLGTEIKIGLLFSLTGTTSVTERGQYQAALLAIRQLNDNGGILGARLVPVTEDISSDPRLSAEKAEKLISQDNVAAIVGLYTSACRKVTIPVLETYNKLLFYPALYEGEELCPHIFYCGPVSNQQLQHFIPWIIQNIGSSIVLIGSDYVYPRETNKHIRLLVKKHNGTIVGEHYVTLGMQKFHQVIKDIANRKPDVVFSTLVGDSAIAFYQQFRAANMKIPIASSITGETEIHAMGVKNAEGHYTSFPYFSSISTIRNQEFRKLYAENYGTAAVSFVMESAYYSVMLFAEAVKKAHSLETEAIREALCGMRYQAPQGMIRVDDSNQHVWLQSRIGRVNAKGEFDIVWESNEPIPPLPFYNSENNSYDESNNKDVCTSVELLRRYQEEYGSLIEILQRVTKYFPYRFAVFNPDGVILAVFEHEHTKVWETLSFFHTGVKVSQKLLGRSGISLALAGQSEAVVSGPEHEREELKHWLTIGMPIQSQTGSFLGVLGVFIQDWPIRNDLLEVLCASFRQFIESSMECLAEKQHRLETDRVLSGAVKLFSEGYVAVQDDRIVASNELADSLLEEDALLFDNLKIQLKNKKGPEILLREGTVQNVLEVKGRTEDGIHHLLLKRVRTPEVRTVRKQIFIRDLVGSSSVFLKNIQLAELAAQMDANVLILGESGTGKELFARAIHNGSSRRDKPFIAINCAALPRDLLNAELFGYMEGAFTGAKRGGSPGKFEMANGGTLFLDEIGDMPIEQQAALLRVLQEKEVVRIGGGAAVPIDVRIISATNKRLTQEIAYNGSFRSDLYFRLNVFTIELAPLRNRKQDILELVNHFIREFSQTTGIALKIPDEQVKEILLKHAWPGNIRELRNVVERSFYLSGDSKIITLHHLPEYLYSNQEGIWTAGESHDALDKRSDNTESKIDSIRMQKTLTEKTEIKQFLQQYKGNISRCAKELGISRTTLYRKLKEHKLM